MKTELNSKDYVSFARRFVKELIEDMDVEELRSIVSDHIHEEIELRDLALGIWEADDEDDLIEEVTTACGWCIKSIDYDIQLKQWHTTSTIGHGMDYNSSITKEFHYEL